MSVYDPEKQDSGSLLDSPSDDDLRHITGISGDEEGAMDREARLGHARDVLNAENRASDAGKSDKSADEEAEQLKEASPESFNKGDNGDSAGFFKNNSESKKGWFKGKITTKQAAAGGAGLLGVGSIAAILTLSSGALPFQHMSNLMQGFHFDNNSNMQDGRLTRLWRYARGRGIDNNLGRLGNRYAQKVDARLIERGITPQYNSRRLTGFEFDLKDPRARAAVEELRAKGYDIGDPNSSPVDGKVRHDLPRGRGSTRGIRSFQDDLRIALSEDGVSNAMTHRLSKARAGAGFHPLQNFYREVGESIVDYVRSVKHTRAEANRTGTTPDGRIRAPTDAEVEAERARVASENAPDGIRADTPDGIKFKIKAAFASTIGIVGLYELMCNLDSVGGKIDEIRYAEVVLPLIRTGIEGVSLGSQTGANIDVNAEELGALFTRFYGETDAGNLSAFAADSIRAEEGKEQIGERTNSEGEKIKPADLPPSSKPGKEKPALFQVVDGFIGAIPGGKSACGALTTFCLGPICVGDVLDGIAAGFSGGASGVAANATIQAAFIGAGTVFEDFIDSFINWLAGAALECKDGPGWGSCVNFGSRLAANDAALSMGGRELEPEEEIALDNQRKELDRYDMKGKSFYARYIDPNQRNSLFASSVLSNPNFFASATTLTHHIKSPLSSVSNIFGNFGNLFGARAKAISTAYDYGFPEYGYSLGEQLDERFENPYEIANEIEPQLDELNDDDKYGKCFGTTISSSGSIITEEAVDYKDIPARCNDKSDDLLLKYRFYIADTLTLKSASCYEGADENACTELGFETQTVGTGATLDGVECPANIESLRHPSVAGYYQMPDAPNGEYTFDGGATPDQRYGSKQLVCVLYSVALAYKAEFGDRSTIDIGDLNASGHKTHYKGVAVDLSADGSVTAANDHNDYTTYSDEATITLGKLFIDTGAIKNIWWCPPDALSDDAANGASHNAIRQYAESKGTPVNIKCITNHASHFHVDIADEYALPGSFMP